MNSETSGSGQDSTIDLAVFEQLKEDLGEDVIGDLVKLYLDHTSGMVAGLPPLLESADYLELGRAAHGIKGASSNLGISDVENAAKDLEECCKGEDQSDASALTHRLIQRFETARVALQPYAEEG